ncbi:type II toxin-antitoxin system RelE/ParE family toxin [Aliikangiella coralliicola]|uniref:Type II toxin-antitoxin system RelE/ParE family toxin n=1 Tax=Aliikangiella coralliicola TaxID=2592383 RepID=A0A545TWE0_9GAMM|nr:type II toxin-antitoxin system RelE/ParE family toxin [Aliikangiella coralliicola]TQV81529.1 type II toxin-antitoxin system RelE/ParE family toxin [Aliikangiella coralliicola]
MKIKILSSAKRDLSEGFLFYEKQSSGLGEYFLDSLFSDIDSLMIYAGTHQIFFDNYYRMLSKRFPFAIYYQVKNQTSFVYAVLDCRRNPGRIKEKLTTT